VPKTPGEILNRINEISFNSSLMREMRSVCFVTKLIEEQKILDKTIKRVRIHSIEADDVMQAMSVGIVAVANEQCAGRPVFRFRKRKTISWNDLVPRMPAAIFLGDDGESR
jgi:hypothetical protein